MMKKNNEAEFKVINFRFPKDIWLFIKQTAVDDECSMTDLVVKCVNAYKKKIEKRASKVNTNE
jgi:hypothetical protein